MTQETKVLRLFTSELLDHEGNPNGIHIGCDDLQVCKQFHIENKTSQSIQEWVAVEELHATLISLEEEIQTHSAAVYECTQLLSEVRAQRDALCALVLSIDAGGPSLDAMRDARAAIALCESPVAAAEGEKK